MTDNNVSPDLAQRIAEALSRTGDPRTSSDGTNDQNFKVIGVVPTHLRHLHNLLADLGSEAAAAEAVALKAKMRHSIMHSVFFDSLATHVPDPEGASGIMILENWDVVAMVEDDERDDPSAGPSGGLDRLFGDLFGFGGHRGSFG